MLPQQLQREQEKIQVEAFLALEDQALLKEELILLDQNVNHINLDLDLLQFKLKIGKENQL